MLEPFLGTSGFADHGQRVVEGQRLMQAASDIMLGWIRVDGLDGVEPRLLRPPAVGQQVLGGGRDDGPASLTIYAEVCGRTLAKAHARSGDAIAIASYLGAGDPSTGRWPRSPSPTPTRTSATTTPSVRQGRPGVCRSRRAF